MSRTYNILPKNGNILQKISLILHILWHFFPSMALLVIFAIVTIALPQSGDLLVKTSENVFWYPGILVLLGLFFLSYMIWYTGRIIAYFQRDLYQRAPGMLFHLPRLLGFYIYAVFMIAFLCKPDLFVAKYLNVKIIIALLITVGFYYWLLNVWIKRFSVIFLKRFGFKTLTRLYNGVFWLNLGIVIGVGILRNTTVTMIVAALLMQGCFLFLVSNRKRVNEIKPPLWISKVSRYILKAVFGSAQQRIPKYEDLTFLMLNLLAIVSILIYALSIFWMEFSIGFGTLGIILLAFAMYTGLFNLIKVLSWVYKVNILFFLIFALILGSLWNETHRVHLVGTQDINYDNRPSFRHYLMQWVASHQSALTDDTTTIIPMIFVHSDGGASRSGYWVASVLGRLDSISDKRFSQHLFALSGASGGSLGNMVYYALLEKSLSNQADEINITAEAQSFLKTDFLTFTIARLTGIEALSYIIPFADDRARTLERSLEYGMDSRHILYGNFARTFSSLSTHVQHQLMPIICINTTRMQDGKPGIICNVRMDSTIYGNRLDVLSLLPDDRDMNISSSVILGARFPYLSPAGRIDEKKENHKNAHYFVDGGYFDNSGAGVIHEMIMEVQKLLQHDAYLNATYGSHLQKIKCMVIHIYNTPIESSEFKKKSLLINDLAAPLLTLAGSYTSQTSVNDSRLKIYMDNLYEGDSILQQQSISKMYHDINLYKNDPQQSNEHYTMNWVISEATLARMRQRLEKNEDINNCLLLFK